MTAPVTLASPAIELVAWTKRPGPGPTAVDSINLRIERGPQVGHPCPQMQVNGSGAVRSPPRTGSAFQSTTCGSIASSIGPDTMLVSTGSSASAAETTKACR